MAYAIAIVVAAILAVIFLAVFLLFRSMARSAQKARDDFARAAPATAQVLQVGHSSSASSYGTVDVELTFEVHPSFGEPYRVRTTWAVDPAAVSKIQPGQTVAVRIHPQDPKKIYSAEAWAQSLELAQEAPDDPDD